MQFHSRPKLLQHLARDSARCRVSFLDSEPLVLPKEIVATVDKADTSSARSNRAVGLPIRFAGIPAV